MSLEAEQALEMAKLFWQDMHQMKIHQKCTVATLMLTWAIRIAAPRAYEANVMATMVTLLQAPDALPEGVE